MWWWLLFTRKPFTLGCINNPGVNVYAWCNRLSVNMQICVSVYTYCLHVARTQSKSPKFRIRWSGLPRILTCLDPVMAF